MASHTYFSWSSAHFNCSLDLNGWSHPISICIPIITFDRVNGNTVIYIKHNDTKTRISLVIPRLFPFYCVPVMPLSLSLFPFLNGRIVLAGLRGVFSLACDSHDMFAKTVNLLCVPILLFWTIPSKLKWEVWRQTTSHLTLIESFFEM